MNNDRQTLTHLPNDVDEFRMAIERREVAASLTPGRPPRPRVVLVATCPPHHPSIGFDFVVRCTVLRSLCLVIRTSQIVFQANRLVATYIERTPITQAASPVAHALFREPRTAARASPFVLPRVVGAAEVVVLSLEVKLLAVPTSNWSLLEFQAHVYNKMGTPPTHNGEQGRA